MWRRNEEPQGKAAFSRKSLEAQDTSVRWGESREEKDKGCSKWFMTTGMTNHLGLPRTQDVQDNPHQTRAVGHPTTMLPQLC